MSFSARVFLLLVLVNVCRAGWFFGPSAAEECIETAVVAAAKGDLKSIQSCLDVGWDVNAKDNTGDTALHYSAQKGKVDVIEALIKAGADVNAKKNDGETALHSAAQEGKVDAIAALIKAGADVNAKKNDGTTALHSAAYNGKVDAIAALIKVGADVNAKDSERGVTAGGKLTILLCSALCSFQCAR